MKQLIKTLALISLTSTFAATVALSQPLITVDEFGNGRFNGNPMPSGIAPDPFSGIATLAYTLPFPANAGDVVLLDPGPNPQQIGDILRFDGNGRLFFFSDRESSDLPPFDPADVAQMPGLIAGFPTIFIQEVGPEGNNGAIYVPNPGDPGYQNGIVGLKYQFISDVPEPTAGALVLLGLGSLAFGKRLRKNSKN
jgi:hypothetical protein